MASLLSLPDFALPFLVALHLCQTTGDVSLCHEAIRLAHETPELREIVVAAREMEDAQ